MTTDVHIRDGTARDLPLLEAMLFEAFFWRPEAERPALEAFRHDAEFVKWTEALLQRKGDRAVVAETRRDGRAIAVGAAFHRLFTDDRHSYGYVDAATPELAIGVAAEARGQGAGAALVAALIERARADGHAAISLSVETDNAARRIYERAGFERVATVGGAWTMTRSLRAEGADQ